MTTGNVAEIWPSILESVGMFGGKALQSAGLPAILGPNALALCFAANYSQHYDQASAGQDVLIAALKRVTGQDWTVRIEKVAGESTAEPDRPTPAVSAAVRQKAILEHPLFKRIADRLGGQMVRMEDGFNPAAVQPKPIPVPVIPGDDGEALPPAVDTEEDEA